MTSLPIDILRSNILDAVAVLASLDERPTMLARVRDFLRTSARPANDLVGLVADVCREAGLATTVVHGPIEPAMLTRGGAVLVVEPTGAVIRVRAVEDDTVVGTDVASGKPVRRPAAELAITDRGPARIVLQGTYRSFLSSDATVPQVRGVTHDHHQEANHRLRDIWPYLWRILFAERRDLLIVFSYSILTSVLSLVVPLSSQAIVNAVALGVFSQQLVVLCMVVFAVMIVLAIFTVLERYVIDMIQRRIFVRSSFDITYRLPMMKLAATRETYAPELVNRFFDVMTIQKSLGKFLMEGINALLALGTGLILLGFYHPFFLIYDIGFVIFLPLLTFVLGRGAIKTAITVSKRKYEAASWMEDVARNLLGFKLTGARDFAFDRIDAVAADYVVARQRHYVILARQIMGSMLFKAAATVGILGLGGALVLEQQISLGQLVAAEIVIIMILGALEKLINQLDLYYDLIAALDKLSIIAEQPLEEIGGEAVPAAHDGGSIELVDVRLDLDGKTVLNGVTFTVLPGSHVSIVGPSGAGKTTLLLTMAGLFDTYQGDAHINGVDVRHADLRSLRDRIGLVVPDHQLIEGTIADNITLGRPFTRDDIRWALSMTHLEEAMRELPDGLMTHVAATGEALPYGMRRRILFARMIVHKPDVLLIDEAFDGVEDSVKLTILDNLFAWPHWTIVNVSHDPEVVSRTADILVLEDGRVVQQGSLATLCQSPHTPFRSLFPDPRPFTNPEEGDHA